MIAVVHLASGRIELVESASGYIAPVWHNAGTAPDVDPALLIWDGDNVVVDLSRAVSEALSQIDRICGAFRTRFITDIPGQQQTYEKKEQEARRWQAGDNAADFPFMAAEATVRGMTMEQVRDDIMAQVNALMPLAAMIEAHRVGRKDLVRAATTPAAITAIVDGTLPALEALID